MKTFRDIILSLFAIVVFALALCMILISAGVLDFNMISNTIQDLFLNQKVIMNVLAASVMVIIAVAICIKPEATEEMKSGIALQLDTGTVYMSRETFESLILSIAKTYNSLRNVKVSVTISQEGVVANLYSYILPDTVVQTLTDKLQKNIKESILKQTTVDIKEVNVKIKGVYSQVDKKV